MGKISQHRTHLLFLSFLNTAMTEAVKILHWEHQELIIQSIPWLLITWLCKDTMHSWHWPSYRRIFWPQDQKCYIVHLSPSLSVCSQVHFRIQVDFPQVGACQRKWSHANTRMKTAIGLWSKFKPPSQQCPEEYKPVMMSVFMLLKNVCVNY